MASITNLLKVLLGHPMSKGLRSGFRGYVTPNEFGGYRISVPIQNIVLREYTVRKKLMFKLSVNELFFPNCYLQLDHLLKELPKLEGVVLCSIFMLPPDPVSRKRIYNIFYENQAELHAVFESIVFKTMEDGEYIEEIYRLKEVLQKCPKTVPDELLPSLNGMDFFSCEPK